MMDYARALAMPSPGDDTGALRRECAALRASIRRLGKVPGAGRLGRPGSPRRSGSATGMVVPTLAETSGDFIGPLNPHVGAYSEPHPACFDQ